MSGTADRPVVIVGAGVSGLSLAVRLAERGVETVVVERESRPGGLARSFCYDGFTFDIGPHRFHTYDPAVERFLRATLGSSVREISRSSKLHFRGRFYPWPLHPSLVLLRFPPGIALGVVRDLLRGYPRHHAASFREQIIGMYGETLYRHFFEGYSTKFLGLPPELTHVDWAKTGVDRAIIDSRLKIQSLWRLAWTILATWKRPELGFLYPAGGCGQLAEILAARVERLGGRVLCGHEVDRLEVAGDRVATVQVGDALLEPSLVVWTGTVGSLATGLGLPVPALTYLPLVCYNLMLTDGAPHDFQWCYHGAADVVFSRVSVPTRFDPGNTPPGRRSLCVEVTCGADRAVWDDPASRVERVLDDLVRERLLRSTAEVIGVRTERIPWAYPVYALDYRDNFAAFRQATGRYRNLLLGGRLGLFWYNNMDHCVEASLELAEQVLHRLGPGASR